MIRLIIRGLVDGALSSLGVVIGASLSNSTAVVLSAGLSGAVANGLSNIMAAFTAEKTSGYIALNNLEKKMLTSLKGTEREKRIEKEVLRGGAYDGIASIIGGALPVIPFTFMPPSQAVYGSIALVALVAAFLGVYTSMHSKENMLASVVKMLVFTFVTAGICISIQFLF
mgnify:CR=1 FL=1